jgi:hypothetical protein
LENASSKDPSNPIPNIQVSSSAPLQHNLGDDENSTAINKTHVRNWKRSLLIEIYLADNIEVFSFNSAIIDLFFNTPTNFFLILVDHGTIDVTITNIYGIFNGLFYLTRFGLENVETLPFGRVKCNTLALPSKSQDQRLELSNHQIVQLCTAS